MKAIKVLLGVIATAIIVVAVVTFIGLSNLDKIVKTAVEEVGPRVTGTSVKLADVNIKLSEGRAELLQLTVANPKGFTNANAISLGQIAVEIDPSSVTGDVIVINEILITKAELLAELKGLKDTNLQALLNNVKSQPSDQKAQAATETSESEVRLAVKKFTFSDSSIQLVSDQFGEKTLSLPAINLRNLGSPDKGLTPDELASAVMQPLLAAAKEAVQDYAENMAKDKAETAVKKKLNEKLGEGGAEKLDQLKSLFGK